MKSFLIALKTESNCRNCFPFLSVSPAKDSIITGSYTQPLWPTHARRAHLKASKCFWCACARCRDATEMGSFVSAQVCQVCGERVLAVDPLDQESEWR